MPRARRVEVALGDDGPGDGPPEHVGVADDRRPHGRRRWWWLTVPVVVVVALAVAQVVADRGERDALADLGRLPGVVDPLDGPVQVAWDVDPRTRLDGAVRVGPVLVADHVTDDLAVSLEGRDVATGAPLWSHEVVAARPGLGEPAYADPVACAVVPDDDAQVVCLVPDSVWTVDDDEQTVVPPTVTRLLVLDAADGTVRVDREAPLWAQWMAPSGDDVLLVGVDAGAMVVSAQDLRDGSTRWRTTIDQRVDVLPVRAAAAAALIDPQTLAVDRGDGVVLVATADGEHLRTVVHTLEAGLTGQLSTRTVTTSRILGAALVSGDGGTVVASADATVTVEGTVTPVVVDDGSVPGLLLTRTPRLQAWDAADGTPRWGTTMVDAQDATVLDGRVHVGTSTAVVTLDGVTGDELWRFSRPTASGSPVTDGRYLYVTAHRGDRHRAPYDLVALHLADGSEVWRAPLPDRTWPQSVAGLLVATSLGPDLDSYEEVHRVLR